MRITEAQLRRIIREEARRVLEAEGTGVYVVHQGEVYKAKAKVKPDGRREPDLAAGSLGFYDEWTGPDPVTPDDDDLYGAENIMSVPVGALGRRGS
jgi:hypothetical protein